MPKKIPLWSNPELEKAMCDIEKGTDEDILANNPSDCGEEKGSESESKKKRRKKRRNNAYSPKKLLEDPFYKPDKVPKKSGIFHTFSPKPDVFFKAAGNEKVYPSDTDQAQIVFGTDRPGTWKSGWGKLGSNRAASIDIVVGRMSSIRNGKGPKDGTYVGNDFAADAARIYISQLTNIDNNFDIAEGAYGTMKQRSGIGIKADGVRIIGREGIKLVTGRAKGWKGFGLKGEPNSLGGKISQPAPPIELIAGNNSDTRTVFGGLFNTPETYNNLQGVARGENTVEAFSDLGKIIDEIWSALFNFMCYQMVFNAAIGPALSPLPAAPIVAGACGTATTAQIIYSLNPLYHTRSNKTIWEANHLQRTGYRFIESRNVFSN